MDIEAEIKQEALKIHSRWLRQPEGTIELMIIQSIKKGMQLHQKRINELVSDDDAFR